MPLARLIYVSEPQLDPVHGSTLKQLAAIMTASRRNNEASNITGALVYDESWFLQVLEGDRRAIWQTFSRINEDERHAGCMLIEMATIESRMFGQWWMSLAVREAATAPAFAPYIVNGRLHADEMEAGDVLSLMLTLSKLGSRREMRAGS